MTKLFRNFVKYKRNNKIWKSIKFGEDLFDYKCAFKYINSVLLRSTFFIFFLFYALNGSEFYKIHLNRSQN